MRVPSLTADLDVQHMQISNQGPQFSFLLLFVTEPGKEMAQDVRKLGHIPCPRTARE